MAATDLVVPTIDTVRHEHLLYSWLAEHKPIVLCGPPGSGKTMTLFSALRGLPDMEVCRFQLYLSLKIVILALIRLTWKHGILVLPVRPTT